MEKFKPVLVPYNARKHVGKTKYVALCGACGNPIEKATSLKFCMFCGRAIDWSNTPTYSRYTLTDKAINYAYNNN